MFAAMVIRDDSRFSLTPEPERVLPAARAVPRVAPPDLSALLHPRSVAVVGATDRPGSYGDAALRNLATLGFHGPVWGVHPTRREVHGRPCVPALEDLPGPVDAVVVAIPAAAVPGVIATAATIGCGAAVVLAAGFAEVGATALQADLAAAAGAMPVLGPNCDGLVAFHGAALWGDALAPRPAGRVALISQSGNVAVNALAVGRGIRFHTVASVGNQAVLDAATLLAALVEEEQLGSVALFLEADGDGARLSSALASAAERGIGVAVLKVGATAAGATAAAAHTGALAGDQRVFRALVEEAGGAWADDVHDLLELAKALAVPGARVARAGPLRAGAGRPGLGVLTCSGGDSGLAADEAGRLGLSLPTLAAATVERLQALLPPAATAGNPLDYTAMIWGERERLAAIVRAVAADPAIDQLLLFYDEPAQMEAGLRASWNGVREGLADGAVDSGVSTLIASTLPELLQDGSAAGFIARGVPAVAGLRTALACVAALRRPAPDPGRLRAIAAAAGGPRPQAGSWLSEAEAKALLRAHGVAVPAGRTVTDAEDAVRAASELGGPVALKASAPGLQHKSELGALVLGAVGSDAVRAGYERVAAAGGEVLLEAMAAPGVELIVAARRDALVPALVVGLGGVWTELLDDVAIVPLPASAARVEVALRTLRGAGVLAGARGGPSVDVAALAALAAAAGKLLLSEPLQLLELNPVIVTPGGAVAVDAVARRGA
jgi:acetyl-CoA synthetase